ncbi:DUF2182 domain-containing protein [Paraburkholderia oxyphila]|uniref:DUF2182 domain-containing protein n=1 Tax=Paraburkholderia oxyphila TaxID=614212 RepID=UPI00048709A5|nr:DUF2182 domain-containing protein [Paraburkholderia oxyphila]
MPPTIRADRVTPVVLLVTLVSWLTLWGWNNSTYAPGWGDQGWLGQMWVAHLCRALSGSSYVAAMAFHLVAWFLMLTAMMLVTMVPLLQLFLRLVRARENRVQLMALLLAGYFIAWTQFGVAAHVANETLHGLAGQLTWLTLHPWVPGAAILATAGGYQLTALKRRCLDRCRSPMTFITMHWHGERERLASFAIGFHHGLYCIGCCWALMLLMFAVGSANLGWMLALAAVMAAEKTWPWGPRIRVPVAVGLLGWSALIVAGSL